VKQQAFERFQFAAGEARRARFPFRAGLACYAGLAFLASRAQRGQLEAVLALAALRRDDRAAFLLRYA